MGKKKVLVAVEATLWGEVKAAAAREGRNVGLVVENALRLYLGPTGGFWCAPCGERHQLAETVEAHAGLPAVRQAVEPRHPTVDELRELVASVPPTDAVAGWVPRRPETARERAQRIAERQAYYREHPEEEGQ